MLTSIHGKLRLMLPLLGVIIALMFLNYWMNRTVVILEHAYTSIVEINNHFAENFAGELSAIKDPEKFNKLKADYQTLYTSCLQCHDSNPGSIILDRKGIISRLQDNQFTSIQLRKTVNNNLNKLTSSVRYIHEHHITALKNFLTRNQLAELPYQQESTEEKNSAISAPELDIIQQTVIIQHTLADIMQSFYILKDSHSPLDLQNDFSKNILRFYQAITTFESYSLDAQDGLLVEELLNSGRTFESSFSRLIQSEELERNLVLQLQKNQQAIAQTVSLVTDIIKAKRDKLNIFLQILEYSSLLFITLFIILIINQGKTIVKSINWLVAETVKIKKDYNYRIDDNSGSEEEFKILSRALNSMAENLGERVQELNKEVKRRTLAEQKKAETEINLQRAEQMNAIGTLAGGIAHDFNNLLTAILGNINLAIYSLPPDHTVYDSMVEAEKASKRAHQLTKQLLTFSKGEAPVKETASIGEVIRESALFILRGSNVDCKFDIPSDLWLVAIDKGQIGQVVQNLVINSDHAMPDGGTITIHCRNHTAEADSTILEEGNFVQVNIQDQGYGIDEEDLGKIFDPYFTTKKKGNIKGSGLGLAIVHSIITRHGGYISVESEKGHGTVFTFFLPATSDNHFTEQGADKDILPGQGSILVMDDETMILDMMKHSLPSIGYTVETAENGEQVLLIYEEAAKRKQPFTVVIMDLTIPGGMGGIETAEKILAKYPNACLLVSSGYAEDPAMRNPARYGFQAALKKPFELQNLSHILYELRQRQGKKEHNS